MDTATTEAWNRQARENTDEDKVYYHYVHDTVEENMKVADVGTMVRKLRASFEAERRRVIKEGDQPRMSAIDFKRKVRNESPEVDKFAREHPRLFDMTLSAYSTPQQLQLVEQMLQLRQAVEQGVLTDQAARSVLNELAINANKMNPNVDREAMCDQRLERKAEEGSFLGFNAADIPQLREAAERMKRGD